MFLLLDLCHFLALSLEAEEEEWRKEGLEVKEYFLFYVTSSSSLLNERRHDYDVSKRQSKSENGS